MKLRCALSMLLLSLSVTAAAQQQTLTPMQSVSCRVATLECQNIPFADASGNLVGQFSLIGPYSQLNVGNEVIWTSGNTSSYGSVTAIEQNMPRSWPVGSTVPLDFDYSLSNGHAGHFHGSMFITRGGRWPIAVVEEAGTSLTY